MDLMAELHRINHSPEAIRARRARKAARTSVVYDQIGLALNKPSAIRGRTQHAAYVDDAARFGPREGASKWNMFPEEEGYLGTSLGEQHPGAAALLVVRAALSEYHLPSKVDLRYHGMHRTSGHGAYAMDEGIVMVQADFASMAGARHSIEIPVVVKNGRMLDPSVLIHQGVKRIITQHTFDDIVGMGEFKQKVPDRINMFAPPPGKDAQPAQRQVPIVNPGMYTVLPKRMLAASKRALIQGAVSGIRTARDPHLEEEWLESGDTSWGPEVPPPEPEWADAGDTSWGGEEVPSHPDHLKEEWAYPGEPGRVPPIGSESPNVKEEWDPLSLAHQFKREHPDFAWDEMSMPLAHEYAERHGLDVSEFLDALNSAEYARPEMEPGPGTPMETGPSEYDMMRHLHPLDDPEASASRGARRKNAADPLAEPQLPKAPQLKMKLQKLQQQRQQTQDPGIRARIDREIQKLQYDLEFEVGQFNLSDEDPVGGYADRLRHLTQPRRGPLQGRLVQGFYEPTVTGGPTGPYGKDVPGAGGSSLDPAERSYADALWPSAPVRAKNEIEVRGRDGSRYRIPRGEIGEVVRDADGTNRAYYVRWVDLGYACTVGRQNLRLVG